jgi:hypothetical protein
MYTPEQLSRPTTTTSQLQRKQAPVNNHTHTAATSESDNKQNKLTITK